MKEPMRVGRRGYLTLLHMPTTTGLLSLIAVSSFTTPTLHVDRFILIIVEAFLMVGVAGNYLDETKGRPWKTDISDSILWGVGVASLVGSSLIGLYLAMQVGWWFIFFVAAWGFLTVSYSLELFEGRFHNTETLTVLVGFATLGASLIQDARLTWLPLVIAVISAVIAGCGREHYEVGKSAGRDRVPLPYARRIWRWLMFEIVFVDSIAAIILVSRVFV